FPWWTSVLVLKVFEKYTHLQINLVFTRDSAESLVYDILQLNVLHTGRLMFQLSRHSRYRKVSENSSTAHDELLLQASQSTNTNGAGTEPSFYWFGQTITVQAYGQTVLTGTPEIIGSVSPEKKIITFSFGVFERLPVKTTVWTVKCNGQTPMELCTKICVHIKGINKTPKTAN
ncbi:hypothetical protein T265_14073, partial [Opisthorchis viverrini]